MLIAARKSNYRVLSDGPFMVGGDATPRPLFSQVFSP